jgi:hypothetical protein
MAKKAGRKALERLTPTELRDPNNGIDCACVIHGDMYGWEYVEKLHSMLERNFSYPIRMHVFTEPERPVPGHMIRHDLEIWSNVSGPKRAWWYKMQMFDPRHFHGRMFYLDLDVVITGNLDWITALSPRYFWTIRDFRYLWRPNWQGMNSSVMYWDTEFFPHIWKAFRQHQLGNIMRKYPGDQDYMTSYLTPDVRRFFDDGVARSWRWQVREGGMDMKTRTYLRPGGGSILPPDTRLVIFHGQPKPHEIHDDFMARYWC